MLVFWGPVSFFSASHKTVFWWVKTICCFMSDIPLLMLCLHSHKNENKTLNWVILTHVAYLFSHSNQASKTLFPAARAWSHIFAVNQCNYFISLLSRLKMINNKFMRSSWCLFPHFKLLNRWPSFIKLIWIVYHRKTSQHCIFKFLTTNNNSKAHTNLLLLPPIFGSSNVAW